MQEHMRKYRVRASSICLAAAAWRCEAAALSFSVGGVNQYSDLWGLGCAASTTARDSAA